MQAHSGFHSHRTFAAFSFVSVNLVAQFLRVFPLAAAPAFHLPQPCLVLHLGPFVPGQVAFWRLVAGLEIWRCADDSSKSTAG